MATFCKFLSDRGRANWWILCKEFGVTTEEPKELPIHVEAKIEDVPEIARMMEEIPNYTMESQHR